MKKQFLPTSGAFDRPLGELSIQPQPDDVTCGPTCLQAVYSFYGDSIRLRKVIEEVHSLEGGGTLAVYLACHALRRGYRADIYTYNLQVFDPSWFPNGHQVADLAERIRAQAHHKHSKRLSTASDAYLEYLRLGGRIHYRDLTSRLLRDYLARNIPILTGLSATYLYGCPRERSLTSNKSVFDDVKGTVTGHFVVLCGYDQENKRVRVADPYKDNPLRQDNYYSVPRLKLINAIMLGIVTYDANLLIIRPPEESS